MDMMRVERLEEDHIGDATRGLKEIEFRRAMQDEQALSGSIGAYWEIAVVCVG